MLLKETLTIRAYAFWKIPLIFAVRPRVLSMDDEGCSVQIKLRRFTKNHLGSMYFGALCVGADVAGGLNAAKLSREKFPKVQLVFKDFQAQFLKRPDGDVVFTCKQGKEIEEAVQRADQTGERVTIPVKISATVPSKHGDEPVAAFVLGLSLKKK